MAYIPGERGTSGEPGCTIAEKSVFFGFSRSILKSGISLRVGYPLWGRGTSENLQVPQSWRCWTLVISQNKNVSIPHLSNLQSLSKNYYPVFKAKILWKSLFVMFGFGCIKKFPGEPFGPSGNFFSNNFEIFLLPWNSEYITKIEILL